MYEGQQSKQSQEVQAKIAIYKARADRKCGEWLKSNLRKEGNPQWSQHSTIGLKDANITKSESSRLQKIADIPEGTFEEILQQAEVETKKITSNMLVNNIDAIITDPPYPKEFIQCFSDLSLFASTHLKKDGFVAVYSGQYHLPDVIKRLSEHLTYVWTFCLYHVGKKQLVNGVNIMCGWKPVLIFSRGKKKMRFSAYDVLVSEEREKHSHEWQQSASGVEPLIEILSSPNDLIVDPFSGSGTFGVVSHNIGRRFIGATL